MRVTLMSLVASMVLACPCAAEEAAAPAADLSRLDALTAQYAKQYRDKLYTEATASAKEALAAAESALGPEDARVAQVLNDLGHLYEMQRDLVRAEPVHERALRIREKLFNSEGPAVVQSLQHLASVYTGQGRHAQAQAAYERTLAIMERTVSPNSPSLLVVLQSYEAALRANGQADLAESMRARIFAIKANNQQLQQHPQ